MIPQAKKMMTYIVDQITEGNPANLLDTADKYCYEHDPSMMHVGDKKGMYVGNVLECFSLTTR